MLPVKAFVVERPTGLGAPGVNRIFIVLKGTDWVFQVVDLATFTEK